MSGLVAWARPHNLLKGRHLNLLHAISVIVAVATLPCGALAQDTSNRIGLGVALVPDYDGSADYQAIPTLNGRLSFGNLDLDFRGLNVRSNLLSGPISAGPVLNYRGGRSDDVENAQVAALPEIDAAVEIGAFVSLPLNGNYSLSGEILGDVSDAHGGFLGTVSANYQRLISERIAIFASASVSLMDDNFAQTYYGVTGAGAAASGLSAYNAGGGLRDIGILMGANYNISARTSLTGAVGYSELLGNAADSPLVAVGDSGQMFVNVGLSFSF
jgi:outer membrane scaffolding protein for murein synthesis (MipA/OmpV family)